MKASLFAISLSAILCSPAAFAGVLQLEDSASKVDGVTISKGGKMIVEGRSTNLVTVGAGVRKKLGGLVKVYVGELLVSDKNKYACREDRSFNSLNDLSGVAVRMSLLRSITSEDLDSAFKDGFAANKVTVTPTIKAFVDAVKAGGNPPARSKIAFTGEKLADGSEVVSYEDPAGKVTSIKGGAGFIRSIFSLWLGNATDSGLQNVRDNFVNCEIK